jgi:hypothetical protein
MADALFEPAVAGAEKLAGLASGEKVLPPAAAAGGSIRPQADNSTKINRLTPLPDACEDGVRAVTLGDLRAGKEGFAEGHVQSGIAG